MKGNFVFHEYFFASIEKIDFDEINDICSLTQPGKLCIGRFNLCTKIQEENFQKTSIQSLTPIVKCIEIISIDE